MNGTPKLNIPLMAENVLQKEVIFNEAMLMIDTLASGVVLDILNAPPASPALGDAYIVGTSPTGLWANYANAIAFYYNGWQMTTPPEKYQTYVKGQSSFYIYNSTGWLPVAAGTAQVLADLADANLASATDGQVATYNGATHRWDAKTPVLYVTDLKDVDTSSLTSVASTNGPGGFTIPDGYVLRWNQAAKKFSFQALPAIAVTAGGSTIDANLVSLDIAGASSVVDQSTGHVKITIPAGLSWSDNGTALGSVSAINFTGAGYTTAVANGVLTLTLAGGSGGSGSGGSIAAMSDVDVTTAPADGQYLRYNDATKKWTPATLTVSTSISSLTDYDKSSGPSDGQVMTWVQSSGKWKPMTPVAAATSVKPHMAFKFIKLRLYGGLARTEIADLHFLDVNNQTVLASSVTASITDGSLSALIDSDPATAFGYANGGNDIFVTLTFANAFVPSKIVASCTANTTMFPLIYAYGSVDGKNFVGLGDFTFADWGSSATTQTVPLNYAVTNFPETLVQLGDIDLSNPPVDGQSLVWDQASSKWKAGSRAGMNAEGAHAAWRISITDTFSGGGSFTINEIEFRQTRGVTEHPTGGSVVFSIQYNGDVSAAAHAFDGDDGSTWWTGGSGVTLPQWIGYVYTSPIFVNEIRIKGGTDFKTFTLDFSDDGGKTWSVCRTFANVAAPAADALYAIYRQTVPTGGAVGQVLAKRSATDFDTAWIDAPQTGGSGGGATTLSALTDVDESTPPTEGQVLTYSTVTKKWMPATPKAGGNVTETAFPYIRFRMSDSASTAFSFAEIAVVDDAGVAHTPSAATSTQTWPGSTPGGAIDGDPGSIWSSNDKTPNNFDMTFQSAITPKALKVTSRDGSYCTQTPTSGDVYGSTDGVSWTWLGAVAFPAWSGAQTQTASLATGRMLAQLTDVDESTPPKDGQALIYDASSGKWRPGETSPYTPPKLADFTSGWANGDGCAAADSLRSRPFPALAVTCNTGKTSIGVLSMPAPSGPFKLTTRFRKLYYDIGANWMFFGPVIIGSGGQLTIISCDIDRQNGWCVSHFNAPTSFGAHLWGVASFNDKVLFTQIEYDGTNVFYRIAPDGVNWVTLAQESAASFLTSIQGLGFAIANNSNDKCIALLEHWHVGQTEGY